MVHYLFQWWICWQRDKTSSYVIPFCVKGILLCVRDLKHMSWADYGFASCRFNLCGRKVPNKFLQYIATKLAMPKPFIGGVEEWLEDKDMDSVSLPLGYFCIHSVLSLLQNFYRQILKTPNDIFIIKQYISSSNRNICIFNTSSYAGSLGGWIKSFTFYQQYTLLTGRTCNCYFCSDFP